jgi:drug/metabolite transporter (DMT)-like permease
MSSVPILTRFVQADDVPSLTIALLRMTITAAMLTPYVLGPSRAALVQMSRRDLLFTVLSGLTFALSLIGLFSSLEYTVVLIAILLANTHPVIVALIEGLVLKIRLGWGVWLGLTLTLGGALVFGLAGLNDSSNMGPMPLLGVALALFTSLAQASYFLAGRVARQRVSTPVFMWLAMLIGAGVALVIALLGRTPVLGFPLSSYGLILLLTISGQVVGQSLLAYCLAILPATLVAISMQGIFVFASIWAIFAFNERPDPVQLLASVIILAGVVFTIARRQG